MQSQHVGAQPQPPTSKYQRTTTVDQTNALDQNRTPHSGTTKRSITPHEAGATNTVLLNTFSHEILNTSYFNSL